MDFTIRDIRKKDINSVMGLLEAYWSFENVKGSYYNDFDLMKEILSEDKYVKLYVAEIEEELVGFVLFNQSFDLKGRSIFIENSFVYEKFRGNGIGISLFSRVLEYALKYNIKKIKWPVSDKDSQYLPLYKEFGANLISDKVTYELSKNELIRLSKNKIDFNSDLFKIRPITNRDLPEIKYFIEEERLKTEDAFSVDIYDLMKYGLGENQLFKMLLVEVDEQIVGLMTYFDYFSAFYGKSSHIQCTFIKKDYKTIGIDKILNAYLMDSILKNNYNYLTIDIDKNDDSALERIDFFNASLNKNSLIVEMDIDSLRKIINMK